MSCDHAATIAGNAGYEGLRGKGNTVLNVETSNVVDVVDSCVQILIFINSASTTLLLIEFIKVW